MSYANEISFETKMKVVCDVNGETDPIPLSGFHLKGVQRPQAGTEKYISFLGRD